MKTIFKVGQKVYDQMFFPDVDGRIVDIHNENNKILLEVKFFSKYRLEPLCMQSSVFYTEKGNMINFLGGYNCETSTLSTKPYKLEMQGFEQEQLKPDFDSMWKRLEKSYKPQIEFYSSYPTQELADAFEALRRLLFIMEYYNEGWKPDWNINDIKYCIGKDGDGIRCFKQIYSPKILCFETEEMVKRFFKEQKYLIEIAKPLL
jgi:hypothetical protein